MVVTVSIFIDSIDFLSFAELHGFVRRLVAVSCQINNCCTTSTGVYCLGIKPCCSSDTSKLYSTIVLVHTVQHISPCEEQEGTYIFFIHYASFVNIVSLFDSLKAPNSPNSIHLLGQNWDRRPAFTPRDLFPLLYSHAVVFSVIGIPIRYCRVLIGITSIIL